MPFTRAPNCATAPPGTERSYQLGGGLVNPNRPGPWEWHSGHAGGEAAEHRVDVVFALADDRQRAAGRADEAQVQAVDLRRPVTACAQRARDHEERHARPVALVEDVGCDPVDERAVAGSHERRAAGVPGQRRHGRAVPLEPVGDDARLGAPDSAAGAVGEAAVVIAHELPGDELRAALEPEADRDEREKQQPEQAASTAAHGRQRAAHDFDAHSLQGRRGLREGRMRDSSSRTLTPLDRAARIAP